MDVREARILGVAHAMRASNGQDKDGASTGEQIAGALAAGRPEWAGYTDAAGKTDIFAMLDRLGAEWFEHARVVHAHICSNE